MHNDCLKLLFSKQPEKREIPQVGTHWKPTLFLTSTPLCLSPHLPIAAASSYVSNIFLEQREVGLSCSCCLFCLDVLYHTYLSISTSAPHLSDGLDLASCWSGEPMWGVVGESGTRSLIKQSWCQLLILKYPTSTHKRRILHKGETTKFVPKLAFLVNLGQAMQAYLVPCWWVSWWLWRAGCISQDTYLLYFRQGFARI